MKLRTILAAAFVTCLMPLSAWAQGQCAMTTSNPQLLAFVQSLRSTCEALQKLCNTYPEHGSCPEGYQPSTPAIALDEASNLEQKYLGQVFVTSNLLFPFRQEIAKSPATAKISPAAKDLYLKEMGVLDNLSRTKKPIVRRLIEQLALQATQDWLEIYGDPLRPDGLYSDPQGRTRPLQEAVNGASLKQDLAVNATAMGTVAAYLGAHASSKYAGKLLNGAPILLAGLRARFPIELAGEMLAAAAPVAAGSYVGTRNKINFDNFLPTPAHLIRFEMTDAFDMSEYDFRAIWGEKEFEVYQNAISDSTFWGAMMFVGYMGGKYGYKLSPGVLRALVTFERGGKVLKFFRITPAGLIIGFVAEEAVKEGLFEYRLHNYKGDLEQAAQKNDLVTVYDKLTKIMHLHVKDLPLYLEIASFYADFKDFGLHALDSHDRANVGQKMFKLTQHLHPLNLPNKTPAYWLQNLMCWGPMTSKDDWFNNFRNYNIRKDRTQHMSIDFMRKLSDAVNQINSLIDWSRGEAARLNSMGLKRAAAVVEAKTRKMVLMRGQFTAVLLDIRDRGGWFNKKSSIDDWAQALVEIEWRKPTDHFNSYYFCR